MSAATSVDRRGVRALHADLAAAQKSGSGVAAYTRWINRPLARGAAAVAASWRVPPDAVTLLSGALSACGLAVLVIAPASAATGLAVAALLAAGYVLDSADGQVARLTGRASPAGEWLDHVVDAMRTPLIHTAVAVACFVHRPDEVWLMAAALGYAVLSSGQFMSQILAEQLSARQGGHSRAEGGRARSLWLLPTDPGALCWAFASWGVPAVFGPLYVLLLAANVVHAVASMRRKHARLVGRGSSSSAGRGAAA